MRRVSAEETKSPYYPPRARWYSRPLQGWFRLRHRLQLEQLHLPGGLSPVDYVLSLVIPGYSFMAVGRHTVGLSILAAWSAVGIIFLAALGYPTGNVAFALVISAHAVSIYYAHTRSVPDAGIGGRLGIGVAIVFLVTACVYVPLTYYCGRHWIMPLHVRDQVVVIAAKPWARHFDRGELMAYSVSEEGALRGVHVGNGFGVSAVLAVSGDTVEFEAGAFRVNGVLHRSMAHMPVSGGMVVPENHWFVWPELDIRTGGNVTEATISDAMLKLGVISPERVVGKPFNRWFWRRQISS